MRSNLPARGFRLGARCGGDEADAVWDGCIRKWRVEKEKLDRCEDASDENMHD